MLGGGASVKTWLLHNGRRLRCWTPFEGADYALFEGTCPLCGNSAPGVQGTGQRPSSDDSAWEADAVTTCCKKPIGIISVETNTLFGVREDEAVLAGRCRVY
jgi:hypothetical protein